MRIVLAVEFCFDARTEQRIKLHARLTKKSEQQFFSVKTKFFSVKINMQCWFLSDVAHDCFIHSLWACARAQHVRRAWSTQHLPISSENRHQQRRWKTTNFFTTLLHSLLAKRLQIARRRKQMIFFSSLLTAVGRWNSIGCTFALCQIRLTLSREKMHETCLTWQISDLCPRFRHLLLIHHRDEVRHGYDSQSHSLPA